MLIEMDGFSVTLQRKRVKNINLRIGRTGEVQISAPIKTPLTVIHNFLNCKHSWIEMHRHRLLQMAPESHKKLISGEYIDFQGRKYQLQVHETQTSQHIALRENQIHFFVKPCISQAHKELLLTQWYRAQIKTVYPPLIEKWQSIMGVSVNQISIKKMKSRWGSCHPIKKHITLNLRLIEKPVRCLEYVIVHELVHLFEASHNQRFYALMSHYLPDWQHIKKQLG